MDGRLPRGVRVRILALGMNTESWNIGLYEKTIMDSVLSSPSALLAISELFSCSQQDGFITLRASLNKALGTDVFEYDLPDVGRSSRLSMQGESVEDRLQVAREEFAEEGYFVVCMSGGLSGRRHMPGV